MARESRFGRVEGWAEVKALIELAKQADEADWTPGRRERTFRRILARVERADPARARDPLMTLVPSN